MFGSTYVMAYLEIQRRPIKMSEVGYGCGGNVGGFGGWTSTSAILVLFILLVIITKSFWL